MDPYAVRWGEHEPPPAEQTLRAGVTTLAIAGAAVRRLCHGPVRVLVGLAVVVRDRNWGTAPAQVLHREVTERDGRHRVELRARHRLDEIDFEWAGSLELTPGRLTAEFHGQARAPFHRNRLGWCLLHPLELAGTAVDVPGGSGEGFPERISPHQPLRAISTLGYSAGGLDVNIELDGEEFETEDQRNWTDPSYKTYSTPLDLPFPVLIRSGEQITQRVDIRMTSTRPRPNLRMHEPTERIELGAPVAAPALGLGYPLARDLEPIESRLLDAALPDFLHIELDARETDWPDRLAAAAALGTPLEVAVIAESPDGLGPVLDAVAKLTRPARSVAVFDAASHISTPELVDAARARLPGTAVTGGTRAHFAELNRATELPLHRLDALGYSITPQMHAEDRATVRDTLLTQPSTVRDARVIAHGRPVVVGPIGFRPRFNAVATGPQPPVVRGALPASVDPRQGSVFGAAWTVGALAGLAGADRVVLGDVCGRRGIAGRVDEPAHPRFPGEPGRAFPVWVVLAALRALTRADTMRTSLAPPGTATIQLTGGGTECLLLANLRDEPITLAAPVERDGLLLAADPAAELGWSLTQVPAAQRWTLPAPAVLIASTEPIPALEEQWWRSRSG